MKNFERFFDYNDAAKAYEELTKSDHLMSVTWANIRWLYMDYRPEETRLDYLKRCKSEGILKADGFKEIARIEKRVKKEGIANALL